MGQPRSVLEHLAQMRAKDSELQREYDRLVRIGVLFRIKKLREIHGLTQAEVASRLGTTQSSISALESGKHDPKLGTLALYASMLGYEMKIDFVKK